MIVVDTNVLVYAVRPGAQTDAALAAKRRDPTWLAPAFWRLEMRNVLAVSMRAEGMALETAIEAYTAAAELVEDLDLEPSAEQALRLAHGASISAYDAEFVFAAERLDLRLVTADRRLAERCPGVAVSLADFAEGG
ncbi:MAG TPA: type II toxin-antitoxin system VapC family toxin [Thermoanaerobaculia bacterium]|nr:type II toxin-antitoxin system VapC family toxin [Thermoanaerobaculia bacterium]